MKLKLWVDDIRNAPDFTWTVARTITSAINILRQFNVVEVSLDHDISHQIGMGELSRPYPCPETFMPVADYICAMQDLSGGGVGDGRGIGMRITIHSSNVVAAKEMEARFNKASLYPEIKPMGLANRLEMEA